MGSTVESQVNTGNSPVAMFFNDVSQGRSESQLRFQLIHFWEAKNIAKGGLFLGLELLLIDENGTVMQGFISATRPQTYRRHLKAGATYTLQSFFATPSKEIYRVADQSLTISFSNGSVLSPLDVDEGSGSFPADRFRFHTHDDFQANCGLRSDLYDIVGHLRLVNGQSLIDRPVLDESEIINMGHIVVHIQIKDGTSGMRLQRTVLLVTTVNPKILGGNLALSSMASSRVFIDKNVQPTIDYFNWLGSNPEIAKRVNADEVTKVEAMTIGQIFAYIKQEDAKINSHSDTSEAFFHCVATVDDVVRDRPWYYIACSGCQTKATRGPSSLMCAKCGKTIVSRKDPCLCNNDQAVFVLLGDAGKELTGKPAEELVDNYFEVPIHQPNEALGADHQVPVPQVLLDTIGQTHKFKIKVSDLNLTGKIQVLTVTKIVSPDVLPPLPAPNEIAPNAEDEVRLHTASVVAASELKGDEHRKLSAQSMTSRS
ncbi:hypothetical protein N665_0187s0028 [Sinapis alba]|nr:hypothetical protein N665_0187s0028 [Sinapis alba]